MFTVKFGKCVNPTAKGKSNLITESTPSGWQRQSSGKPKQIGHICVLGFLRNDQENIRKTF